MIGKLTGMPEVQGESLLIEVGGVGYLVKVSHKLLATKPKGATVSLYIYTHVKEETLELYGFSSLQEKELFLLLLGVSGVGPSIALNISDRGAEQIIEAVQNAQVSFFYSNSPNWQKISPKNYH